jgi:hypothetical protein
MAVMLNSLGTVPGDSNLDGRVDAADLNNVGINWQEVGGHLGWGSGDFTCDGRVDSADLNQVGINWQFGAPARVPRAPLAAGVPAARAPVTDVAIIDVVSSDLGKTPERESVASSYEATSGRDFANGLARWRSKAQRPEHIARRAEPSGELPTIQQIADEVFRRFDVL